VARPEAGVLGELVEVLEEPLSGRLAAVAAGLARRGCEAPAGTLDQDRLKGMRGFRLAARGRSTSIRAAGIPCFAIHGTNEPWKIGEAASSGCIRMLNEDVVDLYERVPIGATVLVKRGGRYRA
jgi:hypothetical protein